MKQAILLVASMMTIGATFAQNKHAGTAAARAKQNKNKVAVGGSVRDARKRPLKGVEAFVYTADSTIASSGYTDSSGSYETNNMLPGTYWVKFVYPTEKIVVVGGVVVKKGITMVNISMDEPTADTGINYTDLVPKPADKKGPKADGAAKKSMEKPAGKPAPKK